MSYWIWEINLIMNNLSKSLFDKKPYLIAEISGNHAGDINIALEMIRAAKKAGADCVKTQAYSADSLTIDCHKDGFMIQNGIWKGQSLYELYQKTGTPVEWQAELKAECDRIAVDFLCTPYDNATIDILTALDVRGFKIASFELIDLPLIKHAAKKGKTMFLSCGMATEIEISEAINACRSVGNNDIILLKCCSEYPSQPKNLNLKTISDMISRYNYPIGLSDHSGDNIAAIAATALGASVIEKHFCLSHEINTPDNSFSFDPEEFQSLANDVKQTYLSLGKCFYGFTKAEKESSLIFRRSLYAIKDIKNGDFFTEENIGIIRPGFGLHPKYYEDLMKKRAVRDINYGEPILIEDVMGKEG